MKKLLFFLAVIFSASSFAQQSISISETDTYQELSKKMELTNVGGALDFDFDATPYLFFGAKMDGLSVDFGTITFDVAGNIKAVFVIMEGENGFSIMLSRLKDTFSKKDIKIDVLENIYMLTDHNKYLSITRVSPDKFSIIIRLRPKS